MLKARSVCTAAVFFCVCAAISFGQNAPPPVTWEPGYPDAQPAGFFGGMGTITVFGSYKIIDPTLGTARQAMFVRVPAGGGTLTNISLEMMNGKCGEINSTNTAASPKKTLAPRGSWDTYIIVMYRKSNPNYDPNNPNSPPMEITTYSQTAIVRVTIQ